MSVDSGICEDCGMQFGGMTEAEIESTAAYAASLPSSEGKSYTLLEAAEWRIARAALEQGIPFMQVTGSRYWVAGFEDLLELEEFEAMLGLERYIEVGACD